jgi:hypothetical protein
MMVVTRIFWFTQLSSRTEADGGESPVVSHPLALPSTRCRCGFLSLLAAGGGQHHWAALLLLLPIAACSPTSSVQHTPAQYAPIESTVAVEASRDVVLERLAKKLPAAGFALVEVDSGLKLLRVALTTDHPEVYVNCGRSRRTFEGAWGSVETFEDVPAASGTYKLTSYDGMPLAATRDAMLTANATVRTSPKDSMTEVRVDVSYDLSTRTSYEELGRFGSPTGHGQTVTRKATFQTDKPGIGEAELAFCISNGRLEAQILELAT